MSCASDSCSGDLQLQDKGLGGVYRFRFPITKNDVEWTGIDSVSMVFRKPGGEESIGPFSATLEEPDAGVWYYETVAGQLDSAGYWTIELTVTDGSIVVEYPGEIAFRVRDN